MELINLSKTVKENGTVVYEYKDNKTGEQVTKEVTQYEMTELVNKVSKWGADKGFVRPENVQAQFIKTIEETGEMAGGLLRKDGATIIDSLGDMFVTVILLSDMCGIHPAEALSFAYSEIAGRKGIEVDGVFVKAEDFEEMELEKIEAMGVTKEQLAEIGIIK